MEVKGKTEICGRIFYIIETTIEGYDSDRTGTVTDGAYEEIKTWYYQQTRPFIQQILCAQVRFYVEERGLFCIRNKNYSVENGVVYAIAENTERQWEQGKCFTTRAKLQSYLEIENPNQEDLLKTYVTLKNVEKFDRVTIYRYALSHCVKATLNHGAAVIGENEILVTEGCNITFEFNINARRFFFSFTFQSGEFVPDRILTNPRPEKCKTFQSLVNSFYLDLEEDSFPFPPTIPIYITAVSESETDINNAIMEGLEQVFSRPEKTERFILHIRVQTGTRTVMLKYDDGTRDYIEEPEYKVIKILEYDDFKNFI